MIERDAVRGIWDKFGSELSEACKRHQQARFADEACGAERKQTRELYGAGRAWVRPKSKKSLKKTRQLWTSVLS